MEEVKVKLYTELKEFVSTLDFEGISDERKDVCKILIDYIKEKKGNQVDINLNFICTHNSRRSQFSQIWAKVAATYHGIDINSFSGGVEVTAFNERAVASLKRTGFSISNDEHSENPRYSVSFSSDAAPVVAFSKVYDDPENAADEFASVMTCDHADQNCPFIPGARRISLRYEDPKAFDGTSEEAEKYDERSRQIATELFYIFSEIQ